MKKPVVNAKSEIVVGERMSISLSGDHRVVDGAVGAEFLNCAAKADRKSGVDAVLRDHSRFAYGIAILRSFGRSAAFLSAADKLLIFTGAGISTNSGIPDFRGPQGIWQKRQPVYYDDFLASEESRIEYWDYKLESWPVMSAAAECGARSI